MHQERQETFDWERGREKTIDERFAEWSEQHPDVLVLFERFCRELRAAGHRRGSSKMVYERLRWEKMTSAHGSGADDYALNNIFTSRLSRWLIEKDDSFAGWFEVRALKSKATP